MTITSISKKHSGRPDRLPNRLYDPIPNKTDGALEVSKVDQKFLNTIKELRTTTKYAKTEFKVVARQWAWEYRRAREAVALANRYQQILLQLLLLEDNPLADNLRQKAGKKIGK